MKDNFLLVINPTAGSISVEEVEGKAKAWSVELDFNLEIYKTTGEDDEARVEELLQEKEYKRVIVAGGDGTINMVASKLLNKDIVLGILACGSANGLAASFQIPKKLDEQFKIALEHRPLAMDTLFVNDRFCAHIADIGINAELIYNYETSKASGMLGYARQSIPTLFKSNYPYEFKIKIEDKVIEGKGVLLAFANAKKYGTNAIINPKGKIDDGSFEVILFKRLNIWEVLKTFLKNTRNKEVYMEIYKTKSVSVNCKTPIALQVDGEFIGEYDTFSAQIKPQSLKLAVPNPK
ncbi:diacylglycerol/lipid kinase family protein [Flagellimonas crocea]|uniref:diacylglycerol/lipid kinase family protein n=1 Tax=Flagellimonas crocea TaxID=3067311 RepID=UPI00296E541A|nr:YegS/Rv2252/BmrU family lipid kinase [Muricauda sp. DH64]